MTSGKTLIPGFTRALGITIGGCACLVVIPLASLLVESARTGWSQFWQLACESRALAAYSVSLRGALCAAIINTVLGCLFAWVLAMYQFPGRRLLTTLLDLPFAIPTSVAGIALAYLYSPQGWLGALVAPHKVAYSFAGIVIAMVFVTLPFVVKAVQPVLENLDHSVEEAALTLGAHPFHTFYRLILPEVTPAIWTGFSLVFARSIGEYGSIIFIAGNQPYHTEIAPLMIMFKIEAHDYPGASVIALLMLGFALSFNFLTQTISRHLERRQHHV